MSNKTAGKWLVGCLIAAFAGTLLFAGAMGLLLYGRLNSARVSQADIQELERETAFASGWRGPRDDADAETLFPKTIGAWALVGHDESAHIPELAIDKEGYHGAYESAGTTIDVYAYRVVGNYRFQVFNEARRTLEQANYTMREDQNRNVDAVQWIKFSFSPPERYGRMWWARNWLIVTITSNSAVNVQGFEREYVRAIEAPRFYSMGMIDEGVTPEDRPSDPPEQNSVDPIQTDLPTE